MHQVGAELINPKLQQSVGDLQFAVNHGIACTPLEKGVAGGQTFDEQGGQY